MSFSDRSAFSFEITSNFKQFVADELFTEAEEKNTKQAWERALNAYSSILSVVIDGNPINYARQAKCLEKLREYAEGKDALIQHLLLEAKEYDHAIQFSTPDWKAYYYKARASIYYQLANVYGNTDQKNKEMYLHKAAYDYQLVIMQSATQTTSSAIKMYGEANLDLAITKLSIKLEYTEEIGHLLATGLKTSPEYGHAHAHYAIYLKQKKNLAKSHFHYLEAERLLSFKDLQVIFPTTEIRASMQGVFKPPIDNGIGTFAAGLAFFTLSHLSAPHYTSTSTLPPPTEAETSNSLWIWLIAIGGITAHAAALAFMLTRQGQSHTNRDSLESKDGMIGETNKEKELKTTPAQPSVEHKVTSQPTTVTAQLLPLPTDQNKRSLGRILKYEDDPVTVTDITQDTKADSQFKINLSMVSEIKRNIMIQALRRFTPTLDETTLTLIVTINEKLTEDDVESIINKIKKEMHLANEEKTRNERRENRGKKTAEIQAVLAKKRAAREEKRERKPETMARPTPSLNVRHPNHSAQLAHTRMSYQRHVRLIRGGPDGGYLRDSALAQEMEAAARLHERRNNENNDPSPSP